jgi:transcription elongation factor/antiterminator RfaH
MGIGSKFIASEKLENLACAEPGGARWYAVQCQPRQENIAAVNLERQAYDVFLPRRHLTRRHARKLDTVLAAYFPGYLFIRLDLATDRWRSVNGTIGVTRIVAFGPDPTPVPKGIVETLQTRCGSNGVMKGSEAIRVGRKVRLLTGPFTEFFGKVDAMNDRDRVRVLLGLLGGEIPVSVPSDYLAVIN